MIEVRIPNNIAEYKPKFILGFSGRQVICILVTAFLILLDFKFLEPYIGDFALVLAAIPATAAAAFGWIKPYGMPFEKYLKAVLFQALLAPKCRKARNNTPADVPCNKYYVPIPDSALSEEALSCVVKAREALGIAAEEQKPSQGKKRSKTTPRPRYRKSKAARL